LIIGVAEDQKILDETIRTVNCIKSRPLLSRLFSALPSAMEAVDTQLLLHKELRRLLRGRLLLSRFYELREELMQYFHV
jgi:hypothetical protein